MPLTSSQKKFSASSKQTRLSASADASTIGTPIILLPDGLRLTQDAGFRITQNGGYRVVN